MVQGKPGDDLGVAWYGGRAAVWLNLSVRLFDKQTLPYYPGKIEKSILLLSTSLPQRSWEGIAPIFLLRSEQYWTGSILIPESSNSRLNKWTSFSFSQAGIRLTGHPSHKESGHITFSLIPILRPIIIHVADTKELVMDPGQKFLTWVGSGQPFMVWVWIWKISLKTSNLTIFFSSDQKKSLRVR